MDGKNIHVKGEISADIQMKRRKEMCYYCAQRGNFLLLGTRG